MKEGCLCPPLLFSIVHELLSKQLTSKYPNGFVYFDDIALIVNDYQQLEQLSADLIVWGSPIGIRFEPVKIEACHFHRPHAPKGPAQIWWGCSKLPARDPIFTYLDHTIAGTGR